MRPGMAAVILSCAVLVESAAAQAPLTTTYTQSGWQPRRYPELLEEMQSEELPSNGPPRDPGFNGSPSGWSPSSQAGPASVPPPPAPQAGAYHEPVPAPPASGPLTAPGAMAPTPANVPAPVSAQANWNASPSAQQAHWAPPAAVTPSEWSRPSTEHPASTFPSIPEQPPVLQQVSGSSYREPSPAPPAVMPHGISERPIAAPTGLPTPQYSGNSWRMISSESQPPHDPYFPQPTAAQPLMASEAAPMAEPAPMGNANPMANPMTQTYPDPLVPPGPGQSWNAGDIPFGTPAPAMYCDEMPCATCDSSGCAPICVPPDPCGEFLPFGAGGLKAGNRRVIRSAEFFVPLWQDTDSLFYTDLSGQWDDHDAGNGYFGLGYRTFLDPNWILGTQLYYDLLVSDQGNPFHQGTLGVELMSLNWDMRINGHFPGSDSKSSAAPAGVSDGTLVTRNFRERAYGGVEAEVGNRFLHWGWNDQYQMHWFLGGYYFENAADGFPSYGGPQGRLEMRIFDLAWLGPQSRVELGVEASYDRIRDGQVFGFLRVRVPLCWYKDGPVLDPLRRRMLDTPIHRID